MQIRDCCDVEKLEEIIKLHSISQIFLEQHTAEQMDRVFQDIKELAQVISDLDVKLTIDEEKVRDIIHKHTSEMLDNPGECDIYPTTKLYIDLIETLKSKAGELIIKDNGKTNI